MTTITNVNTHSGMALKGMAQFVAARIVRRYRPFQVFSTRIKLRRVSSVSYPLQLSSVSENHATVYNESLNNPEAFWGHLARTRLTWIKEFDTVMDCDMKSGRLNWFCGGKLNVTGRSSLFLHSSVLSPQYDMDPQ